MDVNEITDSPIHRYTLSTTTPSTAKQIKNDLQAYTKKHGLADNH